MIRGLPFHVGVCYRVVVLTMIVIGERGNLSPPVARDRAKTLAATLPPEGLLDLAIFGFDHDSREIWDIPEARDYFIAFVDHLFVFGVSSDRLLPSTLQTLEGCRLAREGFHVIAGGTVEESFRRDADYIKRKKV